jgi:ABC-type polysaccharide/polyol phosphate transport system ATPase subunit
MGQYLPTWANVGENPDSIKRKMMEIAEFSELENFLICLSSIFFRYVCAFSIFNIYSNSSDILLLDEVLQPEMQLL